MTFDKAKCRSRLLGAKGDPVRFYGLRKCGGLQLRLRAQQILTIDFEDLAANLSVNDQYQGKGVAL
jgi:hypothetical protein